MLFVVNPHKFMWHWKMSNAELVYSLVGFDTPTSRPTLIFSYLYSLYPTPLPHLSAFHSALPTTNNTHYLHLLTPIQQPSHLLQLTIYQKCLHSNNVLSVLFLYINHITLFSAYQPYYKQCILLSHAQSLQLILPTTPTALRPTRHSPQLTRLPTPLTSAIWLTSPYTQSIGKIHLPNLILHILWLPYFNHSPPGFLFAPVTCQMTASHSQLCSQPVKRHAKI